MTDKETIPVLLVGNKADVPEERQVPAATAQALAKEYGWGFMEGSAKTRTNVVEAFEEITRRVQRYKEPHPVTPDSTQKQPIKSGKRGICLIL